MTPIYEEKLNKNQGDLLTQFKKEKYPQEKKEYLQRGQPPWSEGKKIKK